MGLLNRHGENGSQVRTEVIRNRRKHQLEDVVTDNVEAGSALYTDSLRSYDRMEARGYIHKVIDHAETYVEGQVHTKRLGELLVAAQAGHQGHLCVGRTVPPVPLPR